MIEILRKEECCGCTACASVCPKKCIKMKADFEGFLYPRVDKENCINCGLCEKVCPELKGFTKKPIQAAYATRHKEGAVLESSTSGGAFTAFAEDIIEQGGIVFGVGFSENFKITHMEVQGDPQKLGIFRGSKYIQSALNDTFHRVKDYLTQGGLVLFSGTSCQISGLKNFLQHDYDNLLTIEVICHGTPSPLLWDKYLQYQKEKFKSKPRAISFRKKTYGYHSGTMEIVFEDGKRYTGSARVDYMLKSFFSEIASRPSCYSCICKGIERSSDLSIFDCWNASALIEGKQDDDRGYTNVLVNTLKGRRAFDNAKAKLESWPVDIEKAIELDGIMICQYPKKHKNREIYYKKLNQVGLANTISTFIPVNHKDYIIEQSKIIFYRFGLMRILKKIKR